MSPYFGQSTLATHPSHPYVSSVVADTLTLPTAVQSAATGTALTLPLHVGLQPSTAHVVTPTYTQPLHPTGLLTAVAHLHSQLSTSSLHMYQPRMALLT